MAFGGRKPKEKKSKPIEFRSFAEGYRPLRLVQTGIVALDAVLGGGIPRGKGVEIYGPSRGGKTALAKEVVRAFMDAGGPAKSAKDRRAFWTVIGGEHFDDALFKRLGGSVDLLDYDEAFDTTAETFFERAERWMDLHASDARPKIEVLDSLAALASKHELDVPMDKASMARAQVISRGFRRIAGPMSRSLTTFLFINQIRDRTGVFFGSSEFRPGGHGPEFFTTVRLRLSQGTLKKGKRWLIKTGGVVTGNRIKVQVDKNRLMPSEGRSVELEWHFLTGFDAVAGSLRLLADSDLIDEKTRGSDDGDEVFEWGGKRIEDEEAFVDAHHDLFHDLWRKFRPENVPGG